MAGTSIAQALLGAAWAATVTGTPAVKPWPWADIWPVARLSVSRLDIERIVLAGANGEALAFGPGHVSGSAAPGTPGNVVIAGHRDTHFRFLERLALGDRLDLHTAAGQTLTYAVTGRFVVDQRDTRLIEDGGAAALTLVTCYPFDGIDPGGRLRYVVRGKLVERG